MVHDVLRLILPHERGEIRLFNVACLYGVLCPARSKNLERTMPVTRTLPGWMEVAVGSPASPANRLGFMSDAGSIVGFPRLRRPVDNRVEQEPDGRSPDHSEARLKTEEDHVA
jgi:hypothetical protein